jgi:hypothetical protein
MTIHATPAKLHWNYYLALERDIDAVSRYVEFCEPNFSVFSIELAHLLFAAASEVDVVAKLLCELIDPTAKRSNINEYRAVLLPAIPGLPTTEVNISRYGLRFLPWKNWTEDKNPDWWRSYNDVKHERNIHFNQATLKNALNALGALHILTFHLYWQALKTPSNMLPSPVEAMAQLKPDATLMRLDGGFFPID